MSSRYGEHCPSLPDALTLFEVGGRLSALGHSLGCEVFSQFPPTYRAGRAGQTIDYVWAVRTRDRGKQRRWNVVAAFECEGLNAPDDSLANDVERLTAVADSVLIPTAVVLYRTCEDGSLFWRGGRDLEAKQQLLLESATSRLRDMCGRRGCPVIPAVLDKELMNGRSAAMQRILSVVRAMTADIGSVE